MIHSLFTFPMMLLASASPAVHAEQADAPVHTQTLLETAAQDTLFFVVDFGIVALSLAFVMCLYRLLRGPTLADRGLAGDTISMQVVGIAILLTIQMRTVMFFDAVLIISILGFASTLAFAQFIARRRAV